MADSGRYVKALGLESDHRVKTDLSPEGALTWGVSKAPALAGGLWADWVYAWANKKWPNYKRGSEFLGSVAVVVGAYAMQVLATRYQQSASHLTEKMTDGMIGRVAPFVVHTFKNLFASDKTAPTPKGPDKSGGVANASLDGDREAVRDVAGLLHNSPETTQLMADQLFQIMKRDGHDVDANGHKALVSSFREASRKIAGGEF